MIILSNSAVLLAKLPHYKDHLQSCSPFRQCPSSTKKSRPQRSHPRNGADVARQVFPIELRVPILHFCCLSLIFEQIPLLVAGLPLLAITEPLRAVAVVAVRSGVDDPDPQSGFVALHIEASPR